MKKGENKMVGTGESQIKLPSKLVCVRECVIVDAGEFRVGEEVTDKETIKKVAGSPCFSPAQEA